MNKLILVSSIALLSGPVAANETPKPLNTNKLESIDAVGGTTTVDLVAFAPNGLLVHHASVATSSPADNQTCTANIRITVDSPTESYSVSIASVSARGGSNAVNRSFNRPLKIKYDSAGTAELVIGGVFGGGVGCLNSGNLLVQPRAVTAN